MHGWPMPLDESHWPGHDVGVDDVARLSSADRSDLFRAAAEDREVLASIIEKDFWVCWARYELATPGSLRLTPADHLLPSLRADFGEMAEEMMFGEVPAFDAVVEGLMVLEASVNA